MKNFGNELCAAMAKMGTGDYVAAHNNLAAKIDYLEHQANETTIDTMADYVKAYKLKGVVSSLYCYLVNNKTDSDRASYIEGVLGNKLYKFVKHYHKLTPDQRLFARYACWRTRFTSDNFVKVGTMLYKGGLLRVNDKGRYFVVGLHYAVGDNVFGVNRRTGQEHRLTVKTVNFQAFPISFQDSRKTFLDTLPVKTLEPLYDETCFDNYKGCVKPISLPRKEWNKIREQN